MVCTGGAPVLWRVVTVNSRQLLSGFVPSCLPSPATAPPDGADWFHEVKHDGFRLQVLRDRDRVRLFTRRGFDWIAKYLAIVAAAQALGASAFLIDGEAVAAGDDGAPDFERMREKAPPRWSPWPEKFP